MKQTDRNIFLEFENDRSSCYLLKKNSLVYCVLAPSGGANL